VLDGSAALDVGRHYWGLYVAGEEISRGRSRLPVQRLDPLQDVSGALLTDAAPPLAHVAHVAFACLPMGSVLERVDRWRAPTRL
jgi:hypothetical protein